MARKPTPKTPDAQTWADLRSFTSGLYDEMDKLGKKAPSAQISDLALQRVNRAIREAKVLLGVHDNYVADLAEFVPAGENPEVRDAVLVLKEILQGLTRANRAFDLTEQLRGY